MYRWLVYSWNFQFISEFSPQYIFGNFLVIGLKIADCSVICGYSTEFRWQNLIALSLGEWALVLPWIKSSYRSNADENEVAT